MVRGVQISKAGAGSATVYQTKSEEDQKNEAVD